MRRAKLSLCAALALLTIFAYQDLLSPNASAHGTQSPQSSPPFRPGLIAAPGPTLPWRTPFAATPGTGPRERGRRRPPRRPPAFPGRRRLRPRRRRPHRPTATCPSSCTCGRCPLCHADRVAHRYAHGGLIYVYMPIIVRQYPLPTPTPTPLSESGFRLRHPGAHAEAATGTAVSRWSRAWASAG